MTKPLHGDAMRATNRLTPGRALLLFIPFVAALLAVESWAARSERFLALPHSLGALVVTLDLAVFAPLVYWWLVVRRAGVSAVTLVPVVSIGLALARALLPAEQRAVAEMGRYLLVPAELGFAWWAVRRVRSALARARVAGAHDAGDVVVHLRRVVREILPSRVVADVVVFELALLYYAFASWRSRPHAPPDARAFTTHRESGVVGLLVMGGVLTVIETAVVHILVLRWSATVAWVLTALSVYGLVWIAGFIQALRLRPVLVTPNALVVRVGMLTSVEVPFAAIARVTPATFPYPDKETPGYLRAFIGGDPNLIVELTTPLRAEGAYGMTREVRSIGLTVDAAAELRTVLDAALHPAAHA